MACTNHLPITLWSISSEGIEALNPFCGGIIYPTQSLV